MLSNTLIFCKLYHNYVRGKLVKYRSHQYIIKKAIAIQSLLKLWLTLLFSFVAPSKYRSESRSGLAIACLQRVNSEPLSAALRRNGYASPCKSEKKNPSKRNNNNNKKKCLLLGNYK